jgi:signal peptidase I
MDTKSKIHEGLSDTFQTILLAFGVFLIIYLFLFRPFQVSGSSMYPNFTDREYVLANIVGLTFSSPKRGDVIVFHPPAAEPGRDYYIKRVMAIPGDTVKVQDGDVYINEEKVDQSSFLSSDVKTFAGTYLHEGQEVKLQKDEYFVMGDNRSNSSDSREWGVVKKDAIVGESMLVYWPPNEAKIITNPLQ